MRLRDVGDRHEARDDRHLDASGARPPHERQKVLVIEEKLRDEKFSARRNLGHEVRQIGIETGRLRVPLGVTRGADAERVAFFPYERDKLTRVCKAAIVRGESRLAFGRITTQGQDVLDARMRELFERVAAATAAGTPIREVIIATNPSPEGDVTLLYLQERLGDSVAAVTSMARGLPFGADLQYADAVTILRSLEERRGVE